MFINVSESCDRRSSLDIQNNLSLLYIQYVTHITAHAYTHEAVPSSLSIPDTHNASQYIPHHFSERRLTSPSSLRPPSPTPPLLSTTLGRQKVIANFQTERIDGWTCYVVKHSPCFSIYSTRQQTNSFVTFPLNTWVFAKSPLLYLHAYGVRLAVCS